MIPVIFTEQNFITIYLILEYEIGAILFYSIFSIYQGRYNVKSQGTQLTRIGSLDVSTDMVQCSPYSWTKHISYLHILLSLCNSCTSGSSKPFFFNYYQLFPGYDHLLCELEHPLSLGIFYHRLCIWCPHASCLCASS